MPKLLKKKYQPMDKLLDKVLILKRSELFEDISEHLLLKIAEALEVIEIPNNGQLITQGEIGHDMFILVDGQLEVKDELRVLATLENGAVVGELSIISPVKRTTDVYASKHSLLYKLSREDFLELLHYHKSVSINVMKVLVQRIITLNKQVKHQDIE